MPRLHGFHRFLPRLWELFFAPMVFFRKCRILGSPGSGAPRVRLLSLLPLMARFDRPLSALLANVVFPSVRLQSVVDPQNRNNPDFHSSLPILLNW
jgi:hypothetical protein